MPRITGQVRQPLLDELDANAKSRGLSRSEMLNLLLLAAPAHDPRYIGSPGRYGPPLIAPPLFGDCRDHA